MTAASSSSLTTPECIDGQNLTIASIRSALEEAKIRSGQIQTALYEAAESGQCMLAKEAALRERLADVRCSIAAALAEKGRADDEELEPGCNEGVETSSDSEMTDSISPDAQTRLAPRLACLVEAQHPPHMSRRHTIGNFTGPRVENDANLGADPGCRMRRFSASAHAASTLQRRRSLRQEEIHSLQERIACLEEELEDRELALASAVVSGRAQKRLRDAADQRCKDRSDAQASRLRAELRDLVAEMASREEAHARKRASLEVEFKEVALTTKSMLSALTRQLEMARIQNHRHQYLLQEEKDMRFTRSAPLYGIIEQLRAQVSDRRQRCSDVAEQLDVINAVVAAANAKLAQQSRREQLDTQIPEEATSSASVAGASRGGRAKLLRARSSLNAFNSVGLVKNTYSREEGVSASRRPSSCIQSDSEAEASQSHAAPRARPAKVERQTSWFGSMVGDALLRFDELTGPG